MTACGQPPRTNLVPGEISIRRGEQKEFAVGPNKGRSYFRRDRVRDPALTTMLAIQCLVKFAAPFATMGYQGVHEALQVLLFAFTFLVCLISRGPVATTLAILAFILSAAGSVLQVAEPSNASLLLFYVGSISAFIVASDALGYAALAPGEVTVRRGLGAIALYLNIGLMFAAIYRLIWYLIPNSLSNIPGGAAWQAYGTILYFSFVTLTSTGYGDVTPVHPLVRTLANVEAIIGQLFPATLLARLITLELRRHRRQPARSKRRDGGTLADEGHDPDQGHHPVMPPY
jgi:Ion channel